MVSIALNVSPFQYTPASRNVVHDDVYRNCIKIARKYPNAKGTDLKAMFFRKVFMLLFATRLMPSTAKKARRIKTVAGLTIASRTAEIKYR
jgi:hypothetical protein